MQITKHPSTPARSEIPDTKGIILFSTDLSELLQISFQSQGGKGEKVKVNIWIWDNHVSTLLIIWDYNFRKNGAYYHPYNNKNLY